MDLLFVPFGLVVLLSGYRTCQLVRRYRDTTSEFRKRLGCIQDFGLLLGDLTAVALGLIMLATWRGPFMVARLRWHWREHRSTPWTQIDAVDMFDSMMAEMRNEPLRQAYQMLRDLPTVVCLPFALFTWRAWWFVPECGALVTECRDDPWYIDENFWGDEFRSATKKHATLFFGDVGAGALLLPLCFTWRQRHALEICGKSHKPRMGIIKVTGSMLLDIPYALAGTFVAITLFRANILVGRLYEASDVQDRRVACLEVRI